MTVEVLTFTLACVGLGVEQMNNCSNTISTKRTGIQN
jgi:hypothetical protein